MQVKLDEKVLFEIDDLMIQLLAHDLDDPMAEIQRRLHYIIIHKCDQCFLRLKAEWTDGNDDTPSKLQRAGISSIPTDRRELATLIFSMKDYKNKVQRNGIAN